MVKLVTPVTGGVIEVCDRKAAEYISRGFSAVPDDAPKKQPEQAKKRQSTKKGR